MKGLDRDALLLSRKRTRGPLNRVPIIVTYHPCLPLLNSILAKHSSILNVSERLRRAVSNPPLVTYRRPSNLKNLLVRATFKQRQPSYKGNSQCRQTRCKTCQHIKSVDKFNSSVTGKIYQVKASANCKTSNVVYVVECNKC